MIKLSKVSNLLKSDFYLFFQMFWSKISSDELVSSRHIEFICKELQKIGLDILNKKDIEFDWFIFNVPPGSSKSTIVSQMFPSWLMANDESIFTINTSYSDSLATGFIRKSKAIIQSKEFEEIFGKIELTKDNEGHIETKKGGGRYATSTGGTITGSHANLIIVDDPLSVEQSYSKASIDKANRYLKETLPTRKRNKSKTPMILIMQRLNENDPTGMLLNSNLRVKRYCLPAEINSNATNAELYIDGLLDENRMSKTILDSFKSSLGSYGYACQFDQVPAPLEGGIVKKEWFIITNDINRNARKTIFIDGAYTDNKNNDPTGILITSFQSGFLVIHNYVENWYTLAQLLTNFKAISESNNLSNSDEILIEPKASGKDIVSMFNAYFSIPTNEYRGDFVKASKSTRIQTSAPYIQSGKIKLVQGSWNDSFINQICSFPNAKHDECVDLISYSIEKFLIKRGVFMINS